MDSFKLPDLTKAAEVEPEAEEAPEEPEESPEEGNPFLDSATRAIKLSDLKFGRNYHGERIKRTSKERLSPSRLFSHGGRPLDRNRTRTYVRSVPFYR